MTTRFKIDLSSKRISVNGTSINLESSLLDVEQESINNKEKSIILIYQNGGIDLRESKRIWNFLSKYGEREPVNIMGSDYGEEGSEILLWGDLYVDIVRQK